MKLYNSGLSDYCSETKTVGHFLMNCRGNGVARNIKDACKKLQLDHSKNSILNDILFVTCIDPPSSSLL